MNPDTANEILGVMVERDNLTRRLRSYQSKHREEYKAAMRALDELHREELQEMARRARK